MTLGDRARDMVERTMSLQGPILPADVRNLACATGVPPIIALIAINQATHEHVRRNRDHVVARSGR